VIDPGDLPLRLYGRDAAVAACLLDGMTNKEIARAIGGVTDHGVERVLRLLSQRFMARNRVHLALMLERSERVAAS